MLTQYQYESVYGILGGVVHDLTPRIGHQIAQKIMQDFHPYHGRRQDRLAQIVLASFPANQWQGNSGPPREYIAGLLSQNVLQWAQAMAGAGQQGVPQMPPGGGYYGPPQGQQPWNAGPGYGVPVTRRGEYDHCLGIDNAPMAMAPQPDPTVSWAPSPSPAMTMSQHEPAATPQKAAPPVKETPPMTPAKLRSANPTEANELNLFIPDGRGMRRVKHLHGLLEGETSVTYLEYDVIQPANSGFEIFRRLWSRLNANAEIALGYWSIAVNYDRLVYLPDLAVETFQRMGAAVRAKIEARTEGDGDRIGVAQCVVEAIGRDFSKHDWSAVDKALVLEINRSLKQWARRTSSVETVLSILSLEDIPDLIRKLNNMDDGLLVRRILDEPLRRLFLEPKGLMRQKYPKTGAGTPNIGSFIGPNDSALGDLISCNGIEIDLDVHPGLDKMNALLLPPEDRNRIFDELFKNGTVLRIPDSIIIQNAFANDEPWLAEYDLDAFGVAVENDTYVSEKVRNAAAVYGVKPGIPPGQHLARFTPVNTIEWGFYMTTLRGLPGL